MYTCDHCREQIWDDLFDLLEAGDRESLRQHLAACSACQTERATAVAQHRLVAEAARLDREIPLFTAPRGDDEQPVLRLRRAAAAAVRRPSRFSSWLGLAAAVLLVIGLPCGLYQYGRIRYHAAWQAAEEGVAQIAEQREELQARAQRDRDNLVRVALANHLRLQTVGPSAYQLGVVNSYRVWVSDVDGHPVDAPLTARLLDGDKPVDLAMKKSGPLGEWLVELPSNLSLTPESTPRLELAVRGQEEVAPVRTYLRVLEPAYRTHLATDKLVYRAGETIFFRSLTLERFGLKAPDREFTAIYTLTDARGKELRTLRGLTRKDGIGGGEFKLLPNEPAGEYTLTVAEAENRFPAVTRRLWLQPAPSGPGTTLPSERRLEVEFFPEGGNLVAGLDNRVYFRVRTPQGQPADLQGAIVDSHDRDVVVVQTVRPTGQPARSRGLGVFTLRPQAGETYRLHVSSPQNVEVRAALPPVEAAGLSLSLPTTIVRPNEPIRAVIQQTGPQRNLVVGLFCQGRLVAQELVAAKSGSTAIRLAPTVSCSGILRITVFEEREGQLRPVAERLAYCQPERHLALTIKADKESYAPGATVKLNVRCRNEQGKPEPAWVLVSVVDQAALSGNAHAGEASVLAYFHVTSELQQPADIEQADFLLNDTPEAAAAFDLFLGTQGWRRFEEARADPGRALVHAGATRRTQDSAVPGIVKLDNLEHVERRYTLAVNQAFADVRDALSRSDQDLARVDAVRLQAARTAAQEFDTYQERAGELIRLGGGLGGVVLIAAACLLLAMALVQLARGRSGSRACLAGAFSSLLLCVLIWEGSANGWGRNSHSSDRSGIAAYAAKLDKRLDLAALALPSHESVAPSRAVSQARGQLAMPGSNAEPLAANQGQKLSPVAPERRPRIGIIRAVPHPEAPTIPMPDKKAQPAPLPIRTYAYLPSHGPASSRESPDTILWQPILFTDNGQAEVNFTLPPRGGSFRILAQGHDAAGRLGAVQETLECRQKGPQSK